MKTKSFSAKRGLSATAVFLLSALAVYCLIALAVCSCHTQKHTVTDFEQQSQTTGSHTSVQALQSFDSLLQTVDFSADNVTIEITPPAPVNNEAGSSVAVGHSPIASDQPAIKITAHKPKVSSTKKENNHVVVQTAERDSAASSVHANSHADSSKDVVGVATPMHGTLVTVIVLLAVLLIAAIVLLLFLRKYRII